MRTIAALLLLTTPGQAAGYFTGNALYEVCTSEAAVDHAFCSGYALGVFEKMMTDFKVPVCPPSKFYADQFRDVVVKYLKDNPAERDGAADPLVTQAFLVSWTC